MTKWKSFSLLISDLFLSWSFRIGIKYRTDQELDAYDTLFDAIENSMERKP